MRVDRTRSDRFGHRTKMLFAGLFWAAMALVVPGCTDADSGAEPIERNSSDAAAERTADEDGADETTDDSAAEADFTEVDATMDDVVAESGLDGAGLVVVHPDLGVVHEHYSGEFDADRVSLIASASKTITAGVLMRLHDDGLLDLDAPVAEVVEWGAANPDVTPAQLLSNSSGLVGLLDRPSFGPYICQYVAGGTLQGCGEQIFTTTEDDDEVVAPDSTFRYGGGQWQVAGAVAEAASGRTWAELIEQTFVEPCGVDSLGYNNHFSQITSDNGPFTYPSQFAGDPSTLAETQNPNMEGGAYITVPDYGKLLLMALRGGTCDDTRVLSEASVERMQTDRVAAYGGDLGTTFSGYGLGWWIGEDGSYLEDGGAFGAVPWIDLGRGYGAYLVVEDSSRVGRDLAGQLRPLIDQQIDVIAAA